MKPADSAWESDAAVEVEHEKEKLETSEESAAAKACGCRLVA